MIATISSVSLAQEKGDADMKNDNLDRQESRANGESQLAEQAGTRRNIKSRHAQMIAIGGTLGTALFVGSGQVLAIGGPAFLLLSYAIASGFVYGVTTAIMEVGTYLPVSGASMAYFANRYASPSLGFALGWLYFYSFGVILAYEITVATIVIDFWPNNVHVGVWTTIIIIVIIGLNLSPVAVYAETEFWFAAVKVIMIIGLLILSVVLMAGGGPDGRRLGFYYWTNPEPTKEYIVKDGGGRLTAFIYALVFSGFSFFFGPELIVSTSGEMKNPRKNLPIASRRYFYRLFFFYVLGSAAIGTICQSTAQGLTSGAGNADASPWVIAIRNAGIEILPSIVNAGILTSAWSAGNSYLYMSSRALYSLAVSGNAPKLFARCNSYGLPIYAVLTSALFTFLAYLNLASDAGVVFNWFVDLTNTAGYTSWVCCCIIFFRFRKACTAQGVSVPYRSKIQPYGAWISLVAFCFLLLLNGFTVFYSGNFSLAKFFTSYIGIPIFGGLLVGHKLTAGRALPWLYEPADVDLTSNKDEVEADAEIWALMDEVHGQKKAAKWWRKVSMVWG